MAPAILGVILGPIAEVNFRRALQTDPDWIIFLSRLISLVFIILSVLSLVYPFWQNHRQKKRSAAQAADN